VASAYAVRVCAKAKRVLQRARKVKPDLWGYSPVDLLIDNVPELPSVLAARVCLSIIEPPKARSRP
jgi:hypothetical protein